MNKLASIIIPVYNTGLYLKECLDSVLGQSYKNIEVLIVEDGSTDKSGELCDSYCHDSRVTVFHQPNRGVSAARNLALKHASGEYCFFVDSDDFTHPDMVSLAVSALEDANADIVIFNYFEHVQTASGFKSQVIKETDRLHGDYSLLSIQKKILTADLLCAVWNKGYRRSLFKDITFPEGEWLEDMVTVPQLVLKAKKITAIPNPLYYYRIHDLSYMHNKLYNVQRDYNMILRFHQREPLAEAFHDPGLSAALHAEILRRSVELRYLDYYLEELEPGQVRWLEERILKNYDDDVLSRISNKIKRKRNLFTRFPSLARVYGRYRFKHKNKRP